MANPLIEALRDLEPYSPAWWDARDRLRAEDPAAYSQWLDDEWRTDQALAELEQAAEDV